MSDQTVFGQTDALALDVAAWVTNHAADFCLPVAAERRFVRQDELKDIPQASMPVSVDVFPASEHGKRQGASVAFAGEYAFHLYLQQQVAGSPDEEESRCGLLAQLRSQIIEGLKRTQFNLTTAVHPVQSVIMIEFKSADAKGLYDLERLLQQHVFESDTILIFKAGV